MSNTDTTNFWKGCFGDEYVARNNASFHQNIALFSKAISSCSENINSVLELGANIGLNIQALQVLLPQCSLSAVEVNRHAADVFQENIPEAEMHCMPIQDFTSEKSWDFVFTKGVLIHIHPDDLAGIYDKMYSLSSKYILVVEYYNTTPVEVSYRGNEGKLFKRDFAGELLDRFQDLRLVDYGFVYHRDVHFEQDDMTWFLLQK